MLLSSEIYIKNGFNMCFGILVMITINNLQSLIILDVNLGLINMFSNLRQGGDNQNIELKLALYIMGVYDIQK